MKLIAGVDVHRDSWFAKFYADVVTEEFMEWWVKDYGHVLDNLDSEDEYWVRCAFAFRGWEASAKYLRNSLS